MSDGVCSPRHNFWFLASGSLRQPQTQFPSFGQWAFPNTHPYPILTHTSHHPLDSPSARAHHAPMASLSALRPAIRAWAIAAATGGLGTALPAHAVDLLDSGFNRVPPGPGITIAPPGAGGRAVISAPFLGGSVSASASPAPLTGRFARITAGAGAIALPDPGGFAPGTAEPITIINATGASVEVRPGTGVTIAGLAAGASAILGIGAIAMFQWAGGGTWVLVGPGPLPQWVAP